MDERKKSCTNTKNRVNATAEKIFGPGESEEKSRWIRYWREGENRYGYYLDQLRKLFHTDLSRSRILDIGCGAGGLPELLDGEYQSYFGIDYKMHILRLADHSRDAFYIQGNGIRLPFPNSSFDYIFGLDVIEHLHGGSRWQQEFMLEISRVMAPLGLCMISTPNWWYPYDAHSRTWGPQYLPLSLADRYIRKRNPEFIKEHGTFRNIKLLRPGRLKKIIAGSNLSLLHSLPCCLDKTEYLRFHPFLGILAYLGMGWLLHVEFWMILTRIQDRKQLRIKLRKNAYFQLDRHSPCYHQPFEAEISFQRGDYYHQLGKGWHWPENSNDTFRWIAREAVCFLESSGPDGKIELEGYSPIVTGLSVHCDKQPLGTFNLQAEEPFKLQYPLPSRNKEKHLFTILIKSTATVEKDSELDPRELSVQLFSVRVGE